MKKFHRIKKAAISLTLAASMLAGCASASASTGTGQSTNGEVNTSATADFDLALMKFMEDQGYADQNYMVSPTSFRAALALAVAGAEGETKDELIKAMGFESEEEINAWYASVNQILADFESDIKHDREYFKAHKDYYEDGAKAPDGKLEILNSIWNNTDMNGKFSKDYKKTVNKTYGADAFDVTSDNFTEKANKWVYDGTNGLIEDAFNNLSNINAALINTVYLKSSWEKEFSSYATDPDTFTTASGEKVQKDFMNQTDDFRYYESKEGKLLILPLNGDLDAVFVIGDVGDVHEAINNADYERVCVKLPKFEIESDFSNNELIDFLGSRGAVTAFGPDADFSAMCPDTAWMIKEILQKTKISVDEGGLEAAAVTAVFMTEACAEFEEPKEFAADQPFKFYICGGQNDQEVLFCGRVAE